MTVKRFTGKMGEGDYNLVGTAHLTSQGITGYSFNLDLNNLDIVSDYYTGHLVGWCSQDEVSWSRWGF